MSSQEREPHRGDFNRAHAEKKTDQYWKDVTARVQLLVGILREEITLECVNLFWLRTIRKLLKYIFKSSFFFF